MSENEKTEYERLVEEDERKALYVDAFLRHFNKTQAAVDAGYADGDRKQCGVIGQRVYNLPQVRAAIKERLADYKLEADHVLKRLFDVATASVDDFYDLVNNQLVLNLQKAEERGMLHVIKNVIPGRVSQTGAAIPTKIELHDQQRAWELIAKHTGVGIDQLILGVVDPGEEDENKYTRLREYLRLVKRQLNAHNSPD